MAETDFDNKFALYEIEEDDDDFVAGMLELTTEAIDEFIETLTDAEVASASGYDDPFNLSERAAAYARERGGDPDRLGFTDTASREAFFSVIEDRDKDAPATAAYVAETLINGNISHARETIVLNRTPHEVAVFTLDVLNHLTLLVPEEGAFGWRVAFDRLHRCVNRG